MDSQGHRTLRGLFATPGRRVNRGSIRSVTDRLVGEESAQSKTDTVDRRDFSSEAYHKRQATQVTLSATIDQRLAGIYSVAKNRRPLAPRNPRPADPGLVTRLGERLIETAVFEADSEDTRGSLRIRAQPHTGPDLVSNTVQYQPTRSTLQGFFREVSL